ncbi:hypothetical protein DFAR_1660002 [Desulfarculales bacterium]
MRSKRLGYSLTQIAETIGMAAEVDMDKAEPIQRGLAYGQEKLAEISQRIEELRLLEQDILAVRQKLLHRLAQLKASQPHPQQEV